MVYGQMDPCRKMERCYAEFVYWAVQFRLTVSRIIQPINTNSTNEVLCNTANKSPNQSTFNSTCKLTSIHLYNHRYYPMLLS